MQSLGGRIAGAGLVIASLAIAFLSALLFGDMSRETDLSREIQAIQEVRSGLESLRDSLHELRFAAYAHARGDESGGPVDRELVMVEAELDYLRAKASERSELAPVLASLEAPVRGFADEAGLVLRGRPGAARGLATQEAWEEAMRSIERATRKATQEVNRKTNQQIGLWANREIYVRALVAGTLAVLVGLGVAFWQSLKRARRDAARIQQLAHFDALTGLANRSLLADRLTQAVAMAQRNAAPLAVLVFDLDGFKDVNDTHGHAVGDALLVAVAQRALACMRASDTVARLGGDEFLVVLPDTDRDGARSVATKLLEAIAEPLDTGKARVQVSASIGGSFLPGRASDADELVRDADAALYRSKREGRNRYSEAPGEGEPVPPGREG